MTGGPGPGVWAKKIVIDPNDYHNAYVLDSTDHIWHVQVNDGGQDTVNGGNISAQWTDLTGNLLNGNLMNVGQDQGALANLQSLEIYEPTAGTPILLVGGLGGVYRGQLVLGSGLEPAYYWSAYGQFAIPPAPGASPIPNFPNVVVTDLHYIPSDDLLLAGTFGRGALVVVGASATLNQAPLLQVAAEPGGANAIRLVLDSSDSSLLDVYQTAPGFSEESVVPLSMIGAIQVTTAGIPTTLTVDESNGVINLSHPFDPNADVQFFAGGTGSDTLIVNDAQDASREDITLGTDQITGLGASILYSSVNHVQLIGGTAPDIYFLANTDPAVQTTELDTGGDSNFVVIQKTAGLVTINSGGQDEVNVGDANGVQDILGHVSVNSTGALDPDILVVNDTGDRRSRTATITAENVTLGAASINYGLLSLSQLYVNGDAISGNIFNVTSTAQPFILRNPVTHTVIFEATTTTTIVSQATDTINIGDQNGVQDILGKLVINETNAPFEADTLNINDQGDTENRSAVTATSTAVTGLAPATISYGVHDLAALNITGDSAAGGNTFYVLNTAPSVLVRLGITTLVFSTTTTINSNAVDTINVGDQNGVQDIEGSLTINAPFPQDTLNINDQGDASGQKATITSTAVTGLAPATISFALHSLKALNITGDSSTGSNTFNVQSTAAPFRFITSFGTIVEPTITTINSNGPDTITVGDSTNHLDGIQGALTVNGQLGGKTALVLADQGTTTNQVYELSATTVQRLTQVNNTYDPNIALITYNYLANLALYAGSGSTNQMFISSTSSGTTTDVYGGSDNSQATFTTDEFVVAGGAGGATLDAILGALNLHGQTASPGGESYVLLNDSLTTGNQTYTLTAGSTPNSGEVSRTGIAPITFDGLILDELFASENTSAVVNVQSNAANMDTIIASEPGDQVNVGSLAPALGGTMANVLGTVEVTGPGPATLTVDDSGDNSARTVTTGQVSGNPNLYSITGLSQGTIEYTSGSVQSLTIDAPSTPQNGITVNGTPTGTALTVHAGFGNVIAFNVPGIGGPLTDALGVDNTTYLFDGPATDNSRVYTINSNLVTSTDGLNLNIIYPTGAPTEEGSFALFTGNPFTDTINVQSTQAGTSWFLDGAPYNPNVFNIGDPVKGLSAVKGEIEVNSETESPTSDAETVNLNDQPDTNPQTFTFSYDSNQNLNNVSWNGGGFQTGGFLAIDSTTPSLGNLVINAGSGNTTFQVKDLRATNTAITLNGGSGNNTLDYSQYVGDITVDLLLGVATGFSGGISKIENVTGSQGNDLIVGDANPNVLIGGTGRNMIIGGAGADTITGGGGDNILIGGTTLYDTNLIALDALFAEWTSTQSIGQRFQAIRNGISVGGQTYALNKTTVLPDNAPDSLIGGAGINWFFVDSDDTINNGAGPGPSDLITHV
jgi:hemolysin type calcium-binding protein